MYGNDPLSRYTHTPGAPVLDRTAARLSVTHWGPAGSAIACGDHAVVVATGRPVIVTEVDHQSGRILARPASGGRAVKVAGVKCRGHRRGAPPAAA